MSDVQGRTWPFVGEVALTAPGSGWRCDGAGAWRYSRADAVALTVTDPADDGPVLDVAAEVDRLLAVAARVC